MEGKESTYELSWNITSQIRATLRLYYHDFLYTSHAGTAVRWRPGQETSLAPPCSNLRSFGSKCTVMKKGLVILLGHHGTPAVIWRPH